MKKVVSVLLILFLLLSSAYAEVVSHMEYELRINDCILIGLYTGEIQDEKPDGYGLYETHTPDGTACHYIGEWKNGIMQGNGAMYWNDGSLEIGVYENGTFVTGQYNYNGLFLMNAKADDDESLNPYWVKKKTEVADTEDESSAVQFIGNRNSHVFHRLDCESVRTMKEKNKKEFRTREEAVNAGYKPCTRCLP